MGKLNFSIQLPAGWTGVPVAIHKRNLTVVKRCLSSDTVELPPGAYYVTAQMPAGQLLSGEVEVSQDALSTAELRPEDEHAESPDAQQAHQHFTSKPRAVPRSKESSPAAKPLALNSVFLVRGVSDLPKHFLTRFGTPDASPHPSFALRLWELPPFGVAPQPLRLSPLTTERGQNYLELTVPAQDRPCLVQLIQPEVKPFIVALPMLGTQGCHLMVRRTSAGGYDLDARPEKAEIDLLLRYAQRGEREEALQTERGVDAEAHLLRKRGDPVAAAVGAYALLRFGELDRLHDWTHNLFNYFEDFPDGAAIYGEHLARLGKHREALQAFRALKERGLPIFSEGLTYAVTRLERYLRYASNPKSKGQSLGEFPKDEVAWLRGRLESYAAHTDFERPLTTFFAMDPAKPGDMDAPPRTGPEFDLTPHFR